MKRYEAGDPLWVVGLFRLAQWMICKQHRQALSMDVSATFEQFKPQRFAPSSSRWCVAMAIPIIIAFEATGRITNLGLNRL